MPGEVTEFSALDPRADRIFKPRELAQRNKDVCKPLPGDVLRILPMCYRPVDDEVNLGHPAGARKTRPRGKIESCRFLRQIVDCNSVSHAAAFFCSRIKRYLLCT